jgi:hypothetical protein
MMHRVFVDTNCFLHLRDLKDLPWLEVFAGSSTIEINVAAVVIDELDRLKTEKSGRLRDRCRAALKLIESASDQPGMRLEIRSSNPKIWLVVAESPRIDWSEFPKLDPSKADDELVATAASEPGEGPTSLLSHDAGPLIRARRIGLAAIRSPESWALPSQTDPLEKENAKLIRELEIAKSTKPLLTACWVGQSSDQVIRLLVPKLPPLPSDVQQRLLRRLEVEHPRSDITATANDRIALSLGGISDYAARSYHNRYDQFLDEAAIRFSKLHKTLEAALHFGEVRFAIENQGQVTAERLRVALNTDSRSILFGSRGEMVSWGGALAKLEPPEPPRDYPQIPQSLFSRTDRMRDPTKFYWLERATGQQEGVLTCEEFRPTEIWNPSFYVFLKGDEGEIAVQVHGKNLGAPLTLNSRVVIHHAEADWTHAAVLSRLPQWMAEVIGADPTAVN